MAEVQIQPQTPPKTIRIPTRHSQTSSSPPKIHDLICVGFGTLGLGLAVALHDTDYPRANTLFLEQNNDFVPDTNTSSDELKQHLASSFAHDLATLRSPTSKFTYLNYLCQVGRLDAIVGAGTEGTPFPQRDEFAAYLSWAAKQMGGMVTFGRVVVGVRGIEAGEGVKLWAVEIRDAWTGAREVLVARNVVFAQGREARFAKTNNGGVKEGGLTRAVEVAREACAGKSFVTIEEKLESLAVNSGGILKTCFEGDAAFSRRAVL